MGGLQVILHGDCREQLRALPKNSIDAIVTDPPYGIGFMGKEWDSGKSFVQRKPAKANIFDHVGGNHNPSNSVDSARTRRVEGTRFQAWFEEVAHELYRVLKPGGHLLAFGGTRTYHRMTVAIEDAGFEIRDSLHWLYGSGFPKSLDVSKAIDKRGGASADFATFRDAVRAAMERNNVTRKTLNEALGNHMLSHYLTAGSQPAVPNLRDYRIIRDTVGLGSTFDALFHDEAEREIIGERDVPVGHSFAGPVYGGDSSSVTVDVTAPATDAARQWDGWGTALKPAHEPIVLARKPLVGTVAANVMEFGTGALNIDATRIGRATDDVSVAGHRTATFGTQATTSGGDGSGGWQQSSGRWPANLILTHSPDCTTECVAGCPVAALNTQSGNRRDGIAVQRNGGNAATVGYEGGWRKEPRPDQGYNGSGGASRFFTTTEWDPDIDVPFLYVAKPSRRERNAGLDGMPERDAHERVDRKPESAGLNSPRAGAGRTHAAANHHPTVKPVALMRHLVRLVTPPGGTVLDPFLGSGTTAVAATLEGFAWIGCELTDDYLPIIEARVAWAEQHQPEPDLTLFTNAE